jgi:hypothetical protein
MRRIGDAGGMRRDLTVEGEDLARAVAAGAQMIVGAPVAEAQLDHRARHGGDGADRPVEARPLRLEPADEAVEPAALARGHGFKQHPRA